MDYIKNHIYFYATVGSKNFYSRFKFFLFEFVENFCFFWKCIFYLFLAFNLANCSGSTSHYVCWERDRSSAVAFQFSDYSATVKDIYSYHVLNSKKEPLNSSMPGGSHILKIEKNKINLQFIQDTVVVRYRLSNGEVVKNYDHIGIEDRHLLEEIHRFHVTFAKIEEYIFDKNKKELYLNYIYLMPPRKTLKQRFVLHSDNTWSDYENLGPLSKKEVDSFPKQSSHFEFPLCEEDQGSIKRFFRSLGTLFRRV